MWKGVTSTPCPFIDKKGRCVPSGIPAPAAACEALHFRECERYQKAREITEKRGEARRAVHIAAVVMQAAGLCRYDTYAKCRRFDPTDDDCVDCIEKWLLAKARREIRREAGE